MKRWWYRAETNYDWCSRWVLSTAQSLIPLTHKFIRLFGICYFIIGFTPVTIHRCRILCLTRPCSGSYDCSWRWLLGWWLFWWIWLTVASSLGTRFLHAAFWSVYPRRFSWLWPCSGFSSLSRRISACSKSTRNCHRQVIWRISWLSENYLLMRFSK